MQSPCNQQSCFPPVLIREPGQGEGPYADPDHVDRGEHVDLCLWGADKVHLDVPIVQIKLIARINLVLYELSLIQPRAD